MTFSLSSRAIIDSIHALAAVDTRQETDTPAPRLLCPDNAPVLAILVRNEFSSLAAAMFPLVTDSDAGDADGETDEWLMTLEVPDADRLSAGMGATVRHAIECLLAVRCIVAVYAFDGISVGRLAEKSRSMLAALRATFDRLSAPGACAVTPWAI